MFSDLRKVYLAGQVTGLKDYGVAWRKEICEKLEKKGIWGINPVRGRFLLGDELYFDEKFITERDINDMEDADAVLVNFLNTDVVSKGTFFEMGYCVAMGIPMIIVIEEDNVNKYFMSEYSATLVCDNLEEAIDYLEYMFIYSKE